jgi:cobalamin biosynthesis protein CbiD
MTQFKKILSGGDLRSLGVCNSVISKIKNQNTFDELFKYLFHEDRLVVMRAADTIEKITNHNPQYLTKHKEEIIELCNVAKDKELKWHLALLIPRLH